MSHSKGLNSALTTCQNTTYNVIILNIKRASIKSLTHSRHFVAIISSIPLNDPDPSSDFPRCTLANCDVLMGLADSKYSLFQSISCQINIPQTH